MSVEVVNLSRDHLTTSGYVAENLFVKNVCYVESSARKLTVSCIDHT